MEPAAFLSYAHFDNTHDDGLVTELANRIAAEVRAQSGTEFPLFVDRNDIKWGQAWKRRIERSLDKSTFFFSVLSPSYFKSEYCLDEARRFLDREAQLGRNDLVLPIYYIQLRNTQTGIESKLLEHQYLDWRDLRFEPLTTPQLRKQIAKAAEAICLTMDRVTSVEETKVEDDPVELQQTATNYVVPGRLSDTHTVTVDPNEKTAFPTISAAISEVPPGTRILIRDGVYEEQISLDKPIELVGGSVPENVKVVSHGVSPLTIRTSVCRISNISFRRMLSVEQLLVIDYDNNSLDAQPAAVIAQGRPDINNCEFVSCAGTGIVISSANPIIRNSKVHGCRGFGVEFKSQSSGSLEDCVIFNNKLANIIIKERSNPDIRRNEIYSSAQSGIYVVDNGQGLIEGNDIYDNGHAGVAASHGGTPVVRDNRITRSHHYGGIYVFRRGAGAFEDNDLRGNVRGALQVTDKCQPNIRLKNNHIDE